MKKCQIVYIKRNFKASKLNRTLRKFTCGVSFFFFFFWLVYVINIQEANLHLQLNKIQI